MRECVGVSVSLMYHSASYVSQCLSSRDGLWLQQLWWWETSRMINSALIKQNNFFVFFKVELIFKINEIACFVNIILCNCVYTVNNSETYLYMTFLFFVVSNFHLYNNLIFINEIKHLVYLNFSSKAAIH